MSTARSSESVFGTIEPKNTKAVFGQVVSFVLDRFTRDRDRVNFVEVGANDGKRADPIYRLVMGGKWKGLLIEPLPTTFEALKESYSGVNGLQFARVAVSDKTGEQIFYAVSGEGDVLSSFSRDAIMKHAETRPGLESRISEIRVLTRGLDDLLSEHGFTELDVAVVDTEGHDDIVLSTLDIPRWSPGLILFEHVLLSRAGSQMVKDRLQQLDYKMIWDRHDCIAIRKGVFESDLAAFLSDVVEAARRR